MQHLSGQKLALDGDIMLYSDKMNRVLSGATSDTQRALNSLAGRLRMSPDEMARDLRQEKLSGFSGPKSTSGCLRWPSSPANRQCARSFRRSC